MVSRRLFRQFRVLTLLFILLLVAGDAWLTKARTTDWDDPLWIVIYPVNVDDSAATSAYIQRLSDETFMPVVDFIAREGDRYGLPGKKLAIIKLGPEVKEEPPLPPAERNLVGVGWWSLQLRYWVMRTGWRYDGPPADIRIFVRFHDVEKQTQLAHSLGLQKGLVGIVNAYASNDYAARNNVVIAHEVLHTLGATDKYNPDNGQPVYPDGFAEPQRSPLYPQYKAEIMGGRIPESDQRSRMPASLKTTMVGRITAREIRWLD